MLFISSFVSVFVLTGNLIFNEFTPALRLKLLELMIRGLCKIFPFYHQLTLTLFRPGFFEPSLTGGGGGGLRKPPLCNFQNIKGMIMTLSGYILRPKSCVLVYVTWGDDVMSRDNYVMMSRRRPSWIRHLGFQNFPKRQKIAKNY